MLTIGKGGRNNQWLLAFFMNKLAPTVAIVVRCRGKIRVQNLTCRIARAAGFNWR